MGIVHGIEMVAKYVTPDLAYIVGIVRARAKIGTRQDITPYAVRATIIFRHEDGVWKVVHRHADPSPPSRRPNRSSRSRSVANRPGRGTFLLACTCVLGFYQAKEQAIHENFPDF